MFQPGSCVPSRYRSRCPPPPSPPHSTHSVNPANPAASFAPSRHARPQLQVILPDYLPGNPYSDLNQPVWCSYAMGARPAVLISADGRIFFQQGWLNTDELAGAIEAYWAQDGKGTWEGDEQASPASAQGRSGGAKAAIAVGKGKARGRPRDEVPATEP